MPSQDPRSVRLIKSLRSEREDKEWYFVSSPHRNLCSNGSLKRGLYGFVNMDVGASFQGQYEDLQKLKRELDHEIGREYVFWYSNPRWAPEKDVGAWSMRVLIKNKKSSYGKHRKKISWSARTMKKTVPTGGRRINTEMVGVAAFEHQVESPSEKSLATFKDEVEDRSYWVEWDMDELQAHHG